ncbi:MAG: alpha-galactosidase [Candidatus Poribacteria bacterium]|nr:alpha-galactosidase [Candidatus Poribacteria bacterium]MDE0506581.1 alpha-galactosidase [Candidatus Poribacteria bacterium]
MQRVSDLDVTRQGHSVVAQSKQFQVKYNLSKGTWDYVDQTGHAIIRNAYTRIVLQDGTSLATSESDGTREFVADPTEDDDLGVYQPVKFSYQSDARRIRINLYLKCYSKAPYIILTVGVENLGNADIKLDRLTVIGVSSLNPDARGGVYLGSVPSDYHLFLNVNPSLNQGVRKIYDGFNINKKVSNQPCYDGVLYDTNSQRSLVFGFLSAHKWWSTVDVGYDSQTQKDQKEKGIDGWALRHRCEHQSCAPGQELKSEIAYLNFSASPTDSYQLYTEMVSKRMNAQESGGVFSGWNVQRTGKKKRVDAAYILGQVNQISQNRLFYPSQSGSVEYIQIEDEWQQSAGSNAVHPQHFPDGMKSVVDKIHAKGLKSGIRFDPFSVAINSKLIKRHPEYFLKDREDKPAAVTLDNGTSVALLDASQPGARANIRERLRQIVDEWGCDLIKANLLSYTIGPLAEFGNFVWHDKSLTSIELYRLGIKLLNQVVGESSRNVLLEGHNTCSTPSIGGFSVNHPLAANGDYLVSGLWNDSRGLKHIISNHAAYMSMHNTAWTNEFGAIAIDEPRPINEVIVAMTAAALSGGIMTCADEFSSLSPARAELLAKLFPLTGQSATPIDLYQNRFPQIWNLQVQAPFDSWNILGVFNWKDQVDDVNLDLGALGLDASKFYLVHDFWNRQYLGVVRGRVAVSDMPSRSARLLCLRTERDTPQLISTDIHFTQGGEEILSAGWDRKSQSFLAVCKPPRHGKGTLFIHVPDGYVPAGTSCFGANYQYRLNAPIYELTFNPTDNLVHASVRFEKTAG